MNKKHETIIGLDLGGTKTAVVEGTINAEILQRTEIPTEAARPFDETFPNLIDCMLADDPEVLQIAEEAGQWMARGMALLIDAFNPPITI